MTATSDTKIITEVRERLGSDLVIMGHHYQNDRVIMHTDLRGDSLELARQVPALRAKYIVFCGVSFMAETAAMLAGEEQIVVQPAPDAGCVMSEMAPAHILDCAMRQLTKNGARVIPLAYVNTSAAIKGIVGQYGGSVCTSANAEKMMTWAMKQGDTVLFLPDENLGENTANNLGIPEDKRMVLDIRGGGNNIDVAEATSKKLLLWPGLCAVHQRFRPEHVDEVRRRDPDALVIVHPECPAKVVKKADAAGSTSKIIKFVEDAPNDSTIYIGTEINLVERLAKKYHQVKRVRPLHPSTCSNMAKTTEHLLATTLQQLDSAEPVRVPEDIAYHARIALDRMLDVCS
ncbi:quinolinate synthase NadA [Desulfobaculum bizertense]|uniref:Quinolinate synthase n=1 Tax=Desulfobaculum bizertense DSM 18034 TaxID=1121442 RepID=A0A1T4W2A7_9BACT|nr:quinolinate synthase NadA [Desulfobaculum bizertense]UIJ38845.1 quinolinate synthase NadA [Desulfobaculum bizertense]SKA71434.1 quinolinate synthetase [Desulfobaculum bizertense DSM 18034]